MGLALDMAGNVVYLASFFVPQRLDLPVSLAGCAFWIAAGIVWPDWVLVAIGVLAAANATRRWRRRRKRAPRSYGAKSRALIAAMVARMRESLRPRPVLRPAPGGAR